MNKKSRNIISAILCIVMIISLVNKTDNKVYAAIATMNTDFTEDGGAFASSDAYQSDARGTAPYTYTVYRYQAGSRRSDATADKGTRVFSSKGTHSNNAVGDTTDISLGKKNTDKLSQIPSQTALSGYFPANTTITFKIKVKSCGHTTDSYCGLKVTKFPSGANANFDKYTVSTNRNKVTIPATHNENWAGTYTATAAYKIGTNDWVENSVNASFTYNSSNGKYKDGNGNYASGDYWQNFNLDYPSTASTAVNASEVWITARGGGSGAYIPGITSSGTATMTVTYTCTKDGNYVFDVMGYAEHCNAGPNYVAFNTDVLSNLVSIKYPHTLAYDANGGSGAPSSNTVTSTSVTENMTVSSVTPTRTGYDFTGWNTASNGTGTSYSAGSTISVGVGTTTLYAQWELTTYGYTIRFNANGGTGSIPKTITADGTDASVVMGDIENVIPTRNGYVFRGWSASPSWNNKRISYYSIKASDGTQSSQTGSNMSYETYCSYTGGNSSVKTLTLYALWETKCSVYYNANGGTGSMASQTYNIGSSGVNIKDNEFTRTGYVFVGWNTSSSGTGTSYQVGQNYNGNDGLTLYAQWKTANVLTVKPNGGKWNNISEDSVFNMTVGETKEIPIPVRAGYKFKSWSVTESEGNSIKVGSTIKIGSYTFVCADTNYNNTGNALFIITSSYNSSYYKFNGTENTYANSTIFTNVKNSGNSWHNNDNRVLMGDEENSSYAFILSKEEAEKYASVNGVNLANSWTKTFVEEKIVDLKEKNTKTEQPEKDNETEQPEEDAETEYAYCAKCYGTQFYCTGGKNDWYGTRYTACPHCNKTSTSYCKVCGSSTRGQIETIEHEHSSLYCSKCNNAKRIKKISSEQPEEDAETEQPQKIIPSCGKCDSKNVSLVIASNPSYRCNSCSATTYIIKNSSTLKCTSDSLPLTQIDGKDGMYKCTSGHYYIIYSCPNCNSHKTSVSYQSGYLKVTCAECNKKYKITSSTVTEVCSSCDSSSYELYCQQCGSSFSSSKTYTTCPYCNYSLSKICNGCGQVTSITNNATSSVYACSSCGSDSYKLYCQQCGSSFSSSSTYTTCPYCNYSLSRRCTSCGQITSISNGNNDNNSDDESKPGYTCTTCSNDNLTVITPANKPDEYAYCANCYKTYFYCTTCGTYWYGTRWTACPDCKSVSASYCTECGTGAKGQIKTIEHEYSALYCSKCSDTERITEYSSTSKYASGYRCTSCYDYNLKVITPDNNFVVKAYSLDYNGTAVATALSAYKNICPAIVYKVYNFNITSLTSNAVFTMGDKNVTLTANWEKASSSTLTVNPNGGTWNGSASEQNFTQNYGTTKNIPVPTRTGYTFTGWIKSNSFYGTLSSTTAAATYTFSETDGVTDTITAGWKANNFTVTYIDVVKETGKELGRSTVSKPYDSSVKGIDIGSSTTDNEYYKNYALVSGTEGYTTATVDTSNNTVVYRYFRWLTTDIAGTVNWTDAHNAYSTRPDEVKIVIFQNGIPVASVVTVSGTKDIEPIILSTSGDINYFEFPDMPAYDSAGNPYTYDVRMYDLDATVDIKNPSSVMSLEYPESIYITTQNGYDITNMLDNPEPTDRDPENFKVQGAIHWVDSGNKLGLRPHTVTIALYQDGEPFMKNGEHYTITVDAINDNTYRFIKLPKYKYVDGEPVPYEYTAEETIVSNYVKDGAIYPLYDIHTDENMGEYEKLHFTNYMKIDGPIIPIIPTDERDNTITVITNTEDKVDIVLKMMDFYITETPEDVNVQYGPSYNGDEYNLSVSELGEIIKHLPSGKYEIDINESKYELKDIHISDNTDNVRITYEDGKYYLVIDHVPGDSWGTVNIELEKKTEYYQSSKSINNYFKAPLAKRIVGGYIELPEDRDVSVVEKLMLRNYFKKAVSNIVSAELPEEEETTETDISEIEDTEDEQDTEESTSIIEDEAEETTDSSESPQKDSFLEMPDIIVSNGN